MITFCFFSGVCRGANTFLFHRGVWIIKYQETKIIYMFKWTTYYEAIKWKQWEICTVKKEKKKNSSVKYKKKINCPNYILRTI